MDTPSLPPEVDARITKVESDISHLQCDVERLTTHVDDLKSSVDGLKIDVAIIRTTYVTKADLAQAMHEMTLRMYGFGTFLLTASTAITYFIARNV